MTHTIDHNKSRSINWFLVISALALIASVIVSVTWVANQLETIRAYRAEMETMRQMMNDWRSHPPPGVDSHIWTEAVSLVYTAHGNVCYWPGEVPTEEMRRLREDMETKSQGPINLDTLDWLWTRLGHTGPHGLKYSTQMRPLWYEMRDAVISRMLPPSSRLQSSGAHFPTALLPPRTRSMVFIIPLVCGSTVTGITTCMDLNVGPLRMTERCHLRPHNHDADASTANPVRPLADRSRAATVCYAAGVVGTLHLAAAGLLRRAAACAGVCGVVA